MRAENTVTPRLPILLAALLLFPSASQERRALGRLDPSGAFFYPNWAAGDVDAVLVETAGGPIDASTYLRYLAGRLDRELLEDLAFDFALARECEARKLARSAPRLARGVAARRLAESGRSPSDDPDSTLQRQFATEALRRLRIDALVRAQRDVDEDELKLFFERRHGAGGQGVRMRQVLVSFSATRRRMLGSEPAPDPADVEDTARRRLDELQRRLDTGGAFTELLGESDDRSTRRLLDDPDRAADAGLVSGYDQQRYGQDFAAAVQRLAVGEIGAVRTEIGFHLVQVLDRKATRFEDVAAELRRQMTAGPATPAEVQKLRRALLEKHRVRIVR